MGKKQESEPKKESWVLEGEYDTICNGTKNSVIIQIVYNTEEEANKALEDRLGRYKYLRVYINDL